MKISSRVSRAERFIARLSSWFEHVAILSFLGMMVSTLIDIIGAKAFHWPLPGGLEVVYFCQLIAVSGALAYSEIDGRHIRVELFVDRFPRIGRAFFHGLVAVLSLALFVVLTWKTYQYGVSLRAANDVTAAARIPLYPFAFWLGLCFIPLCLVLLGELLKAILEGIGK